MHLRNHEKIHPLGCFFGLRVYYRVKICVI